MAGSMNKVILIGRLGRDPELKYTTSGQAMCSFSMATDETYKDREGNRVEQTEWHRIKVWGKTAEFCANYLTKGRLVLVEGKLQTSSWEDQQGSKRYMTEVVVNPFNGGVQFLDSKASAGTGYSAPLSTFDDDLEPTPASSKTAKSGQTGKANRSKQSKEEEDLGPAFPSEASGMDDVPF